MKGYADENLCMVTFAKRAIVKEIRSPSPLLPSPPLPLNLSNLAVRFTKGGYPLFLKTVLRQPFLKPVKIKKAFKRWLENVSDLFNPQCQIAGLQKAGLA